LIDTVDATATSYDDTSLDPSDSVQYEVVTTGNTNDTIVSPAAMGTKGDASGREPLFNAMEPIADRIRGGDIDIAHRLRPPVRYNRLDAESLA
jgi:hypothetical protein